MFIVQYMMKYLARIIDILTVGTEICCSVPRLYNIRTIPGVPNEVRQRVVVSVIMVTVGLSLSSCMVIAPASPAGECRSDGGRVWRIKAATRARRQTSAETPRAAKAAPEAPDRPLARAGPLSIIARRRDIRTSNRSNGRLHPHPTPALLPSLGSWSCFCARLRMRSPCSVPDTEFDIRRS